MSESLEGLQTVIFLDQHDRWRKGDRPLVETYLHQIPDLGTDTERLLDVIYHEILLREEAGETPDLAEYQCRFPELSDALKLQFEVHSGIPGTVSPDFDAVDTSDPPSIDGYRIIRELGRGTYGVVYEAWEQALLRPVALKVIFQGGSGDDWTFREAQAIAQLTHPNIVPVHAVGETSEAIFFSQALITDGTLAEFCCGKPQPFRAAAAFVAILADAVQYAHLRQLIHCDLKPSNILLRARTALSGMTSDRPLADFEPLISDYGLAVHLDAGDRAFQGHFRGTLQYMAPEQTGLAELAIGPATDIYALGVILYELLTGCLPFSSNSRLTTFLQIRQTPPAEPRLLKPEIPGDLNAICLACLAKDPAKRYPSAAALAVDLRRYLSGFAPSTVAVGAWGRFTRWCRRRPAVAALSAAMMVLAVTSFVTVTQKMRQAQRAEQQERLRADELDSALYRNQFLLAVKAWEQADVARAEKILNNTNPHRRSLEWYCLTSLLKGGKRAVPFHASSPIQTINALPEGRIAIQSFDDGALAIDRQSGAKQVAFPCEGKFETRLHRSRTGNAVAMGVSHADQNWFQVWDSTSGNPTHRIGPLSGSPVCCEFIEADDQLVTVSWIDGFTGFRFSKQPQGDQKRLGLEPLLPPANQAEPTPSQRPRHRRLVMERWNLATGERIHTADSPDTGQLMRPVAVLSPDLKYLAWTPHSAQEVVEQHRHEVVLIDLSTGVEKHTFKGHTGRLQGVVFAPDSQRLASYGQDGVCLLWEVGHGKLSQRFQSPGNSIEAASFSPNGDLIAFAGKDREIHVCQTSTGNRLSILRGHDSGVRALAFTGTNGNMLSGDETGHVIEWMIGSTHAAPHVMGSPVIRMALDEQGNHLFTADLRGSLIQYDLATSNWAAHAKVLHQPVHDFAIHPDQIQIATANVEGRLSLGNLNEPSAWRTLEKIPILRIGNPGSQVFSPDGKRLACIDAATRHVLLVDTTTQAFTQLSSEKPYRANSMAIRSDGRLLAAACEDQDIVIWDIAQPSEVRRMATSSRVTYLCFQPQTSNLAGLVWDGHHAVTIWDAETSQQKRRLEGHLQPVHCLAYTPDGKRLITGGADRIVKIWDSESAEELLTIKPFQNTIWGLAVSDDSRSLFVQSGMPPDPSTIAVLGGRLEQETD